MNLNPQYQNRSSAGPFCSRQQNGLNQREERVIAFCAVLVRALLATLLAFTLTSCVTDSAGNTHFDAKTALEVVKTGEALYEDYDRAQHPELYRLPGPQVIVP